jgi:hypothetical protein
MLKKVRQGAFSVEARGRMLIKMGSLFLGSSLIGFLSELYLGLMTLAVFVLAWGVIFLPGTLETKHYLKTVKSEAYQLLQSPNPNAARLEIVIGKLRRFSRDKEALKLIAELRQKRPAE